MNWKILLIPPIAIYAVIFLFISALVGAKINPEATWVWITSLVISIVGLYIATGYIKPKSRQEGLKTGIIWLIVFVVLDLILTLPFTGNDYFTDWRSYLPYLLTILIPTILAGKKQAK